MRLYSVEDYGLGPVWADAWKIGRLDGAPLTGVEVDMHHFLAANVEQVLGAVFEGFDPNLEKQSLVGAIATGFHCTDTTDSMRGENVRLSIPTVSVSRSCRQCADRRALAARRICRARQSCRGLRVLTAAHERLLQTLLGLNRTYCSGVKSLDTIANGLELAPRDLVERIRASYPLRAGESKQTVAALVEDTYD